jgi:hypothetical protein
MEPSSDPAMKGKKDPENFGIKVPRRNVGKLGRIFDCFNLELEN